MAEEEDSVPELEALDSVVREGVRLNELWRAGEKLYEAKSASAVPADLIFTKESMYLDLVDRVRVGHNGLI